MKPLRIFDRRRLLATLALLLFSGFLATSLFAYFVSKNAIHEAIVAQDLPLTSSNIYSEIQKDLVRPILISATMAHDTFLHDWVLHGEKNVNDVARYLSEIKRRHGAFSSFFVSDQSATYYTGEGILKQIAPNEPRDTWYYRVRDMKADYEINVDVDLANADALTIFINYRVLDLGGRYMGATGIGLTVDSVRRMIGEYQQHYHRTIYFVDEQGKIVLFGHQNRHPADLHNAPGLGALIDPILKQRSGSWQYEADGDSHILQVNYLPELKWYLFVEQNESQALSGIRRTLYANLLISALMTLLILFLAWQTLARYQLRLEEMASTDELTGLLNRHAYDILIEKMQADCRRTPKPVSFLLADVDYFKRINDSHGHHVGDRVLTEVARQLQAGLRASDLAIRWGGEEFLLVLWGCDLEEARRIAEGLRQKVEALRIPLGADQKLATTISIGLARFDSEEAADQGISRADAALYRAKQGGRNRVEIESAESVSAPPQPMSPTSD